MATQLPAIAAFAGLVGIGAVLRWLATKGVVVKAAIGLAAINIAGAFLAGLLVSYNGTYMAALAAGGIGTLTTVSGLATQTARIAQVHRWIAAVYLVAMTVGGVAAAWLGLQLLG